MKLSKLYKMTLIVLACSAAAISSAWASASTVAIVPFQINAEKDFTFLQQGIVEMLTSRLSSETVTVLDAETTTDAVTGIKGMSGDSLALMAAAKLKADYVIHGSLTVLGESVSIDAKMLNVTGTKPPFHFFKQSPSMNEVIPQINLMATEINTKVFGQQGAVAATGPAPAPMPQTPPPPSPQSDIHAHPEKLLQNGVINDESNSQFGSVLGSAKFWKSRNWSHLINGLAVGDVNSDGKMECVLVSPKKVLIYQVVQNRMQQLAAVKSPKFTINIGVDIGDINENGTREIFVTALNSQRNAMASYVLEYDGTSYKRIVDKTRWYFRITDTPDRGEVLLGQSQPFGAEPHTAPIMELAWEGGDYTDTSRVLPGNKVNLLGVAQGSIAEGNEDQVVALSQDDRLLLLERNGKEVWSSGDLYGGTPLFYALPPDGTDVEYRSAFYPVRVRSVDLNGDGIMEILVPQNSDRTGRKLSEHRFFKKFKIVGLQWDQLGLTPSWQTRTMSGRAADIAVADFDNDGAKELLAVVISKDPNLLKKAKSALIAFDLKAP